MTKSVTLSLSRAQLKSIIFCSPTFCALNGTSLTDDTFLLPSHLNPGIPISADRFKPHLVLPQVQPNEVPTAFGVMPGENHLFPWYLYPGAQILGNAIQYYFTNGEMIPINQILFHENCKLIPKRLLPLISEISPEIQQLNDLQIFDAYKVNPKEKGLEELQKCLISILFRAAELIRDQNSFEIWVTPSHQISETRKACAIHEIQISKNMKSYWELKSAESSLLDRGQGSAILEFREIPETSHGKILKNFELDPLSGTLIFHFINQNIEIIRPFLSLMGLDQDNLLHLKLQGHRTIQRFVDEIDQEFKARGFELIRRTGRQTIEPSQVQNQIWIETTGHLKFCRQIQVHEKKYEVWNLPRISLLLLQGLNGGLGFTTAKTDRELAQNRRGIKRDRDLKLLKHVGFFALILFETSHFILFQKSSEGIPLHQFSDFLSKLYSKLGSLLIELERKAGFIDLSPALSLDKLCSKSILDLIQEFALHLVHEYEQEKESVYTPEGELQIQSGSQVSLQFFHALIAQIAFESKGQCFLRPRLNSFSTFLGSDKTLDLKSLWVSPSPVGSEDLTSEKVQSYFPMSNWISRPQLLQALLPLQENGYQLFYHGMPLNEMKMTDFRPEFNIVEPPENNDLVQNEKPIDWFELNPKFFFKGVEVNPLHLQRLSQEGVLEFQGKIYLIQDKNLPSIRRLENFWSKIQGQSTTSTRRKPGETYLRLPKSQTLEMLALRASGVSVKGGKRWKKICAFYDSLSTKRPEFEAPPSFKAQLKPYQRIGVQWLLDLYGLGLGGVLADDMGLGKTIQTLAFLECLRIRSEMGAALIVVPTSLTYNWASEAAKFSPQLPVQIFQGKSKKSLNEFLSHNKNAVVICTYGLFTEHQEFFEDRQWNILVFDEAQNLKNITAKRTTASRSILANFKLCLTGTPLENHLGEFYSLLDLVVSGSLGELSSFREKFVSPDIIDRVNLNYLKLKTKPLILRRTKSEILTELPPKIESTIKLPFEQKQEKIYRDIALSWNEKVKGSILSEGESRTQLLMLTALLRLRQACSDPSAIPHVRYSEEPPKITVLMEALEEITESGESALVFTQFLHTFERVKRELSDHHIQSYSLHGGTSRPERERILGEFQKSKEGSVLLMTLKTGGVGLNLVKASYVFHLEPWWNPAVENQATDRAHRIGQQKPVQVYRYLMKESVEEKIEILKERKSARFNALFSSVENLTSVSQGGLFLSQSDFEYLLT